MSCSSGTKVFLISTLAIPLSYMLNRFLERSEVTQPLLIALICHSIGLFILIVIIQSTKHSLQSQKHNEYPFYVFGLLCFICVSCLIMALELEGLISGFMSAFLKHGEPHLRSAFGAMVCHWNGVVIHALALMIVAAITWNNEFIDSLCFWLGAWLNTSLVLIIGILVGKTGPDWGLILHLPYILVPCHMVCQVLPGKKDPFILEAFKPLWQRPYDLMLAIFFVFATLFALLRGILVLDSQIWFCQAYLKNIEPYLMSSSPAPFAKIQMLLYLFHHIPYYLFSIYRLLTCTCYKMPKLSLVYGGASLSAQFTHIGSSIHPRTPYILRVPPDFSSQIIFWSTNLIIALGPIVFTYRCKSEEGAFEEVSDEVMDRRLMARRRSSKLN